MQKYADGGRSGQSGATHKVPLIVDAAAEEDLFKYTEAGADLVIYSGAKAIEGPSAGLVVGKKNTLTGCAYKAKALVEQ